MNMKAIVGGFKCLAVAGLLLSATSFDQSIADNYPTKLVKIIVPYAAGGPTDVISRIIASALQDRLGQPVIVENKPGANTNIGTAAVAKGDADGYTLLISATAFTINPGIYKNIPFDPIKDFEPISLLATSPNFFVASTASGIKSVKDLVAREKAKPGSLNYGTAGIGTPTHLAAEMLNVRAGTKITHIPYAGGAPATQAVLAGQIELGSLALPNVLGFIKGGAMAPLAVTAEKRSPALPDVPTMIELGYPGFVSETTMMFLAPKSTPKSVLDRLATETENVLKRQEVKDRIAGVGFTILGGGPEVLRSRIAKEVPDFADIARKANISM